MARSPCINLCQMDPHSGLCRGCLRTLDEIAAWSRLGDAGQETLLATLARRRADIPGAAALPAQGAAHG